jgi:hypothetical protein
MKDTLVLANGVIIELETGASLSSLEVMSESKEKMLEKWDMLTDENLKTVQVKNGDGLVVANYSNLTLVSETSVIQNDGTVLTKFCLREKTQAEIDLEELKEDMQSINNTIGGIE